MKKLIYILFLLPMFAQAQKPHVGDFQFDSVKAKKILLDATAITPDTTTYKPIVYNSLGKMFKFSYWGSLGGGSTPTLQQVFNTEVGGSVLTKIDSINIAANTGLRHISKTNGFWEFKDTTDVVIKMNTRTTSRSDNPLKITAINNLVGVIPVEQLLIQNPASSGTSAQAMIGFRVHDGSADTTSGWVGKTSGSYTAGGTGIGGNTTYMEDMHNGVALLANNSAASIKAYIGTFASASSVKLDIKNDTIKHNVGLVYQNYGGNIITRSDGTNGGSHYFNTFSTGIPTGLTIDKSVNASSASNSFVPLNFTVPTTGNVGQVIAAASNYSSTVNVPANGFGILANSDNLSLIAGVSGKSIVFTAGGYTSTNQVASMSSIGTTHNKRELLKQGADVASVAGAIALGTDGNSFEITGTNAITLISNLSWQNGSEVTFLFTSTASLTDGTANSGTDIGMELAGNANFTGSAGATLTLILSEIGGTQRWREKARSVQ